MDNLDYLLYCPPTAGRGLANALESHSWQGAALGKLDERDQAPNIPLLHYRRGPIIFVGLLTADCYSEESGI